jgi:valyl-tRNA synthetase
MSKTKGNVQDPLELIDLYGTDALRMAVVIGNTPGNDFTLTPGNLEARRDFVNKLWNVGRFVTASTSADERRDSAQPPQLTDGAHLADRWIVSRVERTIAGASRLMSEYNFGEAGRVVYDFVWDEFADWYLEAHKLLARRGATDGQVLARVYEKLLRLLHPLAPFVTEELWQRLETENAPVSVGLAPWPTSGGLTDPEAETQWSDLMAVVRAARALRADYRIESTRWVEAFVVAGTPERASFWREQADLLGNLPGTRLRPIEVLEASSAPAELAERSISAVAGGVELLLPAAGLFDVGAEEARARTELGEAEKQIERLNGLLSRPGFAEQAPAEVVERERGRLAEQQERRQALARRVETLERLGAGG